MPLSVLELPADTQRCILSSLDPVAECFGGCAECGKPACLGDPDGYWEADGHCPEVVECLDCGAHLCLQCSLWALGFGPAMVPPWSTHPGPTSFKCHACRPSVWCRASDLPYH